jgi:putative peptide zinc metalloprotease protein
VNASATPVAAGRGSTAGYPSDAPEPAAAPRLADGIELLGEYKDSGYTEAPSLMRRADGQVIQMSRLLYLVASRIDGSRGLAAIAQLVSDDLGRAVSADQVRYLMKAKLLPLGIVGQSATPPPTASPLLALRARGTLLPERLACATGAILQPLFRWPVVLAVAVCVAVVDYWLFAVHGLTAGLAQLLRDPVDLLIVVGLSVISAAFHECGHAAGCRYGGARPGAIGVGIYLVWPSFFTNVTDSYRLSRAGRLRTDLGGLYFNLIFMLALAGIYAASSAEILLVVIALTHLEMLEQLLPFVRFDGYFILSDIVGVPDLFARVSPILRSALRTRHRDPRVTGLQRRARVVVTGWVVCVVPLLVVMIGYLLLRFPAINRALWRAASREAHLAATAAVADHYAVALVDALGAALAMLSVVGSVYIATGLARRGVTLGLRWSAGRAGRRLLVALAVLAAPGALAAVWGAQGQFHGW